MTFPLILVCRDDILKWDMAETVKGGPFSEILDVDIFVNCIYLNSAIPPFITRDQIIAAGKQRRLSVVVDVSCDTTNPFNPIPIYTENTTFADPTLPAEVGLVIKYLHALNNLTSSIGLETLHYLSSLSIFCLRCFHERLPSSSV